MNKRILFCRITIGNKCYPCLDRKMLNKGGVMAQPLRVHVGPVRELELSFQHLVT